MYAKLLERGINSRALLFFVDKDLSDYLKSDYPNSQNIFVTAHYSIENYLVTADMFRRIWSELLGLTENREEREKHSSHFENELSRFCKMIIPVMALGIACKLHKQDFYFNNINMTALISFDDQLHITKKSGNKCTFNGLCTTFRIAPVSIDKRKYFSLMRKLKKHEPKRFVRGKFELWFLINFYKKLIEIIKSQGYRLKVRTNLSEDNAVELLGPRLAEPAEIGEFLNNMFVQLNS
jgi:hypothetical protein